MRLRQVLCSGLLAGLPALVTADVFECRFTESAWDPADWTLVKSPRWDRMGTWVQRENWIENATPADATPEEMLSKRAGDTYSSMLFNRRLGPNATIRATMSFAHRMAPLIVIAPELGEDAAGRPEYREHIEVVLYDQGLNVWHHTYHEGKPAWRKLAYSRFEIEADARVVMEVALRQTPKGMMLTVKAAGQEMGILSDALPTEYQFGITGCEGVNRFYDVSLEW